MVQLAFQNGNTFPFNGLRKIEVKIRPQHTKNRMVSANIILNPVDNGRFERMLFLHSRRQPLTRCLENRRVLSSKENALVRNQGIPVFSQLRART